MIENIQMVDLVSQYQKLKDEIDEAIFSVVSSAKFIKGPQVQSFEKNLASYLNVNYSIGCANGTDALQIALMALGLETGDEVIVPAFTYVATAEVIGLLGLKPIMVDVDPKTFNVTADVIDEAITDKTKAIVPVHLFGQSCDMEPIMKLADANNLFVIEDNAQAIGSIYKFSDGTTTSTGTIGHIGCTSFFPSKNLGCFGDGGALFTNDDELESKVRMIANHGQEKKYHHSVIGVNSRLDTIQAAVLDIKLKNLNSFSEARNLVAENYDKAFDNIDSIEIPYREPKSTHVFHQYTIKVKGGQRDQLQSYLRERSIPSMVYYPIPLYKQKAFNEYYDSMPFQNTEELCESVLSFPIHTEMKLSTQDYIIENVINFFS